MLVERRAETGAACFVIDDLSRMSRNTIESLRVGELAEITGVRIIGASDGFDSSGQQSKIMLPMMSSFNEVFIDQLKSKVKRGMDDAFRRGDNIQPPGVGYRMVPVNNPDGSLVFTHKQTVEKRAEIDPEGTPSTYKWQTPSGRPVLKFSQVKATWFQRSRRKGGRRTRASGFSSIGILPQSRLLGFQTPLSA
jgi:hypothetical protein